jgi:hypothetical protein
MQARIHMRLLGIMLFSFLFLRLANDTAAIILDNDANISWSNNIDPFGCAGTAKCRVPVVGAPRLMTTSDPTESFTVVIAVGPGGFSSGREPEIRQLDLVIRDAAPECLESVPPQLTPDGLSKCLPGRFAFQGTPKFVSGKATLHLADFTPFLGGTLGNVLDHFDRDVIITVEASIHLPAAEAPVAITLSGAGRQVLISRIGDVDKFLPGTALDIPTRSTELVRALNQIESTPFPKHAVEFDRVVSSNADVSIGFTHAFDLLREAGDKSTNSIYGATLLLRVANDGRHFSDDFILLDAGVNSVTSGRQRVPLIFLRHLHTVPVQDQVNAYDFTIDLTNVPISILSPGDLRPPISSNLIGQLGDGRLNVIVIGHVSVDFSDLRITLNDPQ